MKTASIRDVRHDLNRILEWIANGEEVSITKRRQPVARLLPPVRRKIARGKPPDVSARLRKVFGTKIISDQKMKEILADNRGSW